MDLKEDSNDHRCISPPENKTGQNNVVDLHRKYQKETQSSHEYQVAIDALQNACRGSASSDRGRKTDNTPSDPTDCTIPKFHTATLVMIALQITNMPVGEGGKSTSQNGTHPVAEIA